jgi:hypothetical protein
MFLKIRYNMLIHKTYNTTCAIGVYKMDKGDYL